MIRQRFVTTAIRGSLGGFVFACALIGLASNAWATDADIVNAAGFEPPSFTTTFLGTGQLEGQVNPPGFGQVISPGQWLQTKGPGLGTARVQSTVVKNGVQAVEVNKAANSDDRWAVPVNHLGYPDYPNPFPPEPAQPCICIAWDMRVQQSAGNGDTTFGPFFGVEAYDDDGNPVGLLGSLGVDAATGDVLYQAAGTGFLTETGVLVSFGAWNHFQIKLDYSTHQYDVILNGVKLIPSIGFVDQTNIPGGLNEFSDADISAIAAAGNAASLALTGTAYYDNFLVREGMCNLVPEPTTSVLTAMGLAMVPWMARRHRRARVCCH
jgi:hypothetical protein